MQHSAKYLIHAEIRTSGVVERSDVVGAIFGQTEGLLGEELDLRDLQDSSKIGRIEVDIESEGGRSFGTFTVASGLDRVETAVLGAALETIERVGPCRAECTVTDIEDARAAKRRVVVDRATELLTSFEEAELTGERLIDEVRKRARVGEITDYDGLPAGPRVETSDAIILVEGRADVRQLLKYGIKNAIAVEGTDIPEAVARLTQDRNTTAFLDGDRGGDLILEELEQVAAVDYVAFAPAGQSVEDLDREAVLAALRKKVPTEQLTDDVSAREVFAPTNGGTIDHAGAPSSPDQEVATDTGDPVHDEGPEAGPVKTATDVRGTAPDRTAKVEPATAPTEQSTVETAVDPTESTTDSESDDASQPTDTDESGAVDDGPETLAGHVDDVIAGESGLVRLLDGKFEVLAEAPTDEAFDGLEAADTVPATVVLDGTVTQRLLDVAAQRGVGQLVGSDHGEFVKQPTTVRVRTIDEFQLEAE